MICKALVIQSFSFKASKEALHHCIIPSVLDLASRQVVGWSLSKHPNAQLAQDAMNNAIARHKPNTSNLMFHSLLLVKVTIKQIVCHSV
jgi:hypothetical protein